MAEAAAGREHRSRRDTDAQLRCGALQAQCIHAAIHFDPQEIAAGRTRDPRARRKRLPDRGDVLLLLRRQGLA